MNNISKDPLKAITNKTTHKSTDKTMNNIENNTKNNSVIVRNMSSDDIDALTAIAIRSFPVPWSGEDFLHSAESEYDHGFVAVYDNKVVGFCIMTVSFDTADIIYIATDPDYRNKGIATLLISSAFDTGGRMGVNTYILEVRAGNAPAISFYKKTGFSVIATRKNYYSSPVEDALVMSRTN